MDEEVRKILLALAEKRGLDSELLEQALLSGDIPEPLAKAMADVLADVGRFGKAADKLDK
jgi:hypothetical protein